MKLVVIVAVMTVLTVACSNGLSDYSEQMNPSFQEHLDEYALVDDALDDALDAMGSCLSAANCRIDDFLDNLADLNVALSRYERTAVVYMDKWALELQPPDEALQFHELTFELFQLRLNAMIRFKSWNQDVSASPNSLIFAPTYRDEMESISEQLGRGDRLFIRILAEARKLGNVAIK